MRILVEEIPESGQITRFQWDPERLKRFQPNGDPITIRWDTPVAVEVEIQRRADHLEVSGYLRFSAQLTCHRCLEYYPWGLDRRFTCFLMEQRKAPTEEEVALEPWELDYEFFDGEVIDVDHLVAEEILLALPFRTLCSEQCRGLCPRCGVNLNRRSCDCNAEESMSAFDELQRIRSRLPEQ